MKDRLRLLFSCLSILFASSMVAAPVGTAFTYQGRLNDGSQPASGNYDLTFSLYDASTNGTQVGASQTNAAVAITNGLFVVALDFGPDVFDGSARWLEIGVRTNGGGAFNPLSPRQPLTPTPYAIAASNLTGMLPATQLTGSLSSAQLSGTYTGAVTFNNVSNSFIGNGSGLTSLNASALASGTVPPARMGYAASNDWGFFTLRTWGDSLTAQNFSYLPAVVTNFSVINGGVGGQGTALIRGRFVADSNSWS